MSSQIVSFPKGTLVFREGDQGGDLIFIQEGRVEIFRTLDGEEFVLATMGPGEVLGTLTCLSDSPRFASARAKSTLVGKRVPREHFQQMLATLPGWMKLIVKDFTNRIQQSNLQFSEASLKVKRLEAQTWGIVPKAMQLCASLTHIGQLKARELDGHKVFFIEEVFEISVQCLALPEKELRPIFDVMIRSGIMKVEREPASKKLMLKTRALGLVVQFQRFLEDSPRGRVRKLVQTTFREKETRMLKGLVKYARFKKLKLKDQVTLTSVDLKKDMDTKVGCRYRPEALDQAKKLELVEVLHPGTEEEAIRFHARTLGLTLSFIETYHQLHRLAAQEQDSAPSPKPSSKPTPANSSAA